MDAPYSPLEYALLNGWQRDFPLCHAPFEEIARHFRHAGTAFGTHAPRPDTVLAAVRQLAARGAISRLGAVFAPNRVGAGALAALAVPPERIEEIAGLVNEHPHVNHNYQREHRFNLWFVVTAPDAARRAAILADIAASTGCDTIAMPLTREYHIDLGFDLMSGHSPARRQRGPSACAPRALSAGEARLARALQDGLALVPHPYAELAERSGHREEHVLATLARWQHEGLVKRFGIVVRHHELGYRANAMVVFDVDDDRADAVGAQLAGVQGVTLCYRRERSAPAWRYNLYCMVHGRSRAEVAPVIERLVARAGAPHDVLFSVRRFKQCGARYFA